MTLTKAAMGKMRTRGVEVVTQPTGPGFWYFAGEIAARNAAAEHLGQPPRYRKTGRYVPHPLVEDLTGVEWRET